MSRVTEFKYEVTIKATEPPPNYKRQQLETIQKEMKLKYGPSVEVRFISQWQKAGDNGNRR
jgi:hypothetical protein